MKYGNCCQKPLEDDELELLENCLDKVSELSTIEISTLYYIAGFVAFREHLNEGLDIENEYPELAKNDASEFTDLVSNGRLTDQQWSYLNIRKLRIRTTST